MTLNGSGGVDDGLKATMGGPEIPPFQEGLCRLPWLFIEVLESQLDLIGPGCLEIQLLHVEFIDHGSLACSEVSGIFQPTVAGLLEFRAALLLGPADLVNSLVDYLHDVESVERDRRGGKGIFDASDECAGHG